MNDFVHVPVMVHEVLEFLRAGEGGTFLDCTVGSGGHAEAILQAHSQNMLIGFDRDMRAVQRSEKRLAPFGERVRVKHSAMADLMREVSEVRFDGVLADLGMSTDQLYEGRGFAFSEDTPLDMRMDETQKLTAEHIVNEYSGKDLQRIFKEGGVGSEARRVAQAVVASRPIQTTAELARVVAAAVPAKIQAEKARHPATVVFQALRISVNDEFSQIQSFLSEIPRCVRKGARLCVISFHSLEDKLVTKMMRSWRGEKAPALWQGAQGTPSMGRLLTPKAVVPSANEVAANKAARSARLRVFEFQQEGA